MAGDVDPPNSAGTPEANGIPQPSHPCQPSEPGQPSEHCIPLSQPAVSRPTGSGLPAGIEGSGLADLLLQMVMQGRRAGMPAEGLRLDFDDLS